MKALVNAGGGCRGSISVGTLQYLMGELQKPYDVICGVSVGALNAAFLGMFKAGEEKVAIRQLTDLWLNLRTEHIYERWFPFGRWHALWEKSFYNSSALNRLVKNVISLDRIRSSGKTVCVGAVSLTTGEYRIFDQTSEYFLDAVIASASFPGMLQPVYFDNQWWADGGINEISPIRCAIELGADEIDVMITSPKKKRKEFIGDPSTIDILKRSIDLSMDRIIKNDLRMVELHNQLSSFTGKKNIKYQVYRPEYSITEDLLDFDHEKIKRMITMGYCDAKNKSII